MRLLRRRVADVHSPAEAGDRDATTDRPAVIGAHGGAGTSTIAALLRPAWDLGSVAHLAGTGRMPVLARSRPLLVVARNTVAAARRATDAVTALHHAGVPIAGLVIVADGAGAEPRDATARFSLLEGRVRGVVRMPFVPGLRLVDDVTQIPLPERARDALASIRGVVNGQVADR